MNVSIDPTRAPRTARAPSGLNPNSTHPVSRSSHRTAGATNSAAARAAPPTAPGRCGRCVAPVSLLPGHFAPAKLGRQPDGQDGDVVRRRGCPGVPLDRPEDVPQRHGRGPGRGPPSTPEQASLAERRRRPRRTPRSPRRCKGRGCRPAGRPGASRRAASPGTGRPSSPWTRRAEGPLAGAEQDAGTGGRHWRRWPSRVPWSNTAQKTVTNIWCGFCPASASLTARTISSGRLYWRAMVRSKVIVTAMNRAAGMPLPDTSPTTRTSRPSSVRTTSYRSPPTSLAGSRAAATSSPVPCCEPGDVGREEARLDLAGDPQLAGDLLLDGVRCTPWP